MAPGVRDLAALLGALAAAIVLGAVARRFLDAQWETVLGVGLVLAALAGVKWRRPANVLMRRISWAHFGVLFVAVELGLVLLSDLSLLGYWTIPSVVILGLGYCCLYLVFERRRG